MGGSRSDRGTHGGANGRLHLLGRLGGLGLAILLSVVTVWGIYAWDTREARSREMAAQAVRLVDRVHVVQALVAQPGTSPAALVAAREAVTEALARLLELDATGTMAAELEALTGEIGRFEGAVDRFLADRAAEVAPNTTDVERAALALRQSAVDAAGRADRVADTGAVLGFVAAAMLAALVVVRRSRESEHPAVRADGTRADGTRAEGTRADGTGTEPTVPIGPVPPGPAADRDAAIDLLQPLIDSLPDRIAIKDAAGRFDRVNLAQAIWLGLDDPARAVGRAECEFFPPAIAEQLAADERRVVATGDPELDRLESLPAGADGTGAGWALVSRVPIFGPAGQRAALIETRRELPSPPEVASRPRLRDRAFVATSEGIAIADAARPGMPLVDVNPAFERLTGLSAAAALGQPPLELLVAGSEPSAIGELRLAMATGGEASQTMRLRRTDGGTFWAEVHVAPVPLDRGPGDGGSFSHVVLGIKDVTERQEAERRVREAEMKYRTLVERTPAVTYAVRVGERGGEAAIYVSPQVEAMLGYSAGAWRTDPTLRAKLVHPDDRLVWEAAHERAAATGQPYRLEYRLIAKDGRIVWVRDEAVLVTDETGSPAFWQGFLLDISDRKSLEERLEHRAFVDPLTGLPSRELLLDRLRNALARAGRAGRVVGLLYLDLDDFAKINDRMGRPAGDQVLRAVGRRLEHCLRQGDTVAWLSGDEFGILLDELDDPAEATRIAERVVDSLRAPLRLASELVCVTGSIGVAAGRSAFDEPEDLLRDAEAAMRDAKERGKGRHAMFEEGMSARAWARLDLELELRRAIDGGDVGLDYQPVVALDGGRIREVEALVRWEHREHGLVAPGDYLPLAEETGLIVPLGLRALEVGCRQVRTWQAIYRQEPPLVLSVKVAGQQFCRPEFAEEVGRVLVLTGLDPACLKLAIAERAATVDVEAAGTTMAELKALGVRLAIADFGTGSSATSYLDRFPIDALTIDRNFVARLGPLGDDATLVRAAIGFAKMLKLGVRAEGVESGEQVRRLRELGCDLGQGSHFARPLPAEVMGELLAATPRWLEAGAVGLVPTGAEGPREGMRPRPRPIGVGTGLLPRLPAIPAARPAS